MGQAAPFQEIGTAEGDDSHSDSDSDDGEGESDFIAVTRTATIAMLTTLIPVTMLTVIATAMAANRNGYLDVTVVTAA